MNVTVWLDQDGEYHFTTETGVIKDEWTLIGKSVIDIRETRVVPGQEK